MYNGVGLRTARGSGTSGHVQKNLSAIAPKQWEQKRETGPSPGPVLKLPKIRMQDPGLARHEALRKIELELLQLTEELESKGVKGADLEAAVDKRRMELASTLGEAPAAGEGLMLASPESQKPDPVLPSGSKEEQLRIFREAIGLDRPPYRGRGRFGRGNWRRRRPPSPHLGRSAADRVGSWAGGGTGGRRGGRRGGVGELREALETSATSRDLPERRGDSHLETTRDPGYRASGRYEHITHPKGKEPMDKPFRAASCISERVWAGRPRLDSFSRSRSRSSSRYRSRSLYKSESESRSRSGTPRPRFDGRFTKSSQKKAKNSSSSRNLARLSRLERQPSRRYKKSRRSRSPSTVSRYRSLSRSLSPRLAPARTMWSACNK